MIHWGDTIPPPCTVIQMYGNSAWFIHKEKKKTTEIANCKNVVEYQCRSLIYCFYIIPPGETKATVFALWETKIKVEDCHSSDYLSSKIASWQIRLFFLFLFQPLRMIFREVEFQIKWVGSRVPASRRAFDEPFIRLALMSEPRRWLINSRGLTSEQPLQHKDKCVVWALKRQ